MSLHQNRNEVIAVSTCLFERDSSLRNLRRQWRYALVSGPIVVAIPGRANWRGIFAAKGNRTAWEPGSGQPRRPVSHLEARLFPGPPPPPQRPAELPDLVTAVYHGSEGQLPLLRALVTSSIGPQIRARRQASRLEASRNALEQIGAGQAETRRAVAIVSLLASADAGVVLADQYGLTLAEAGRASAPAPVACATGSSSSEFAGFGAPPEPVRFFSLERCRRRG